MGSLLLARPHDVIAWGLSWAFVFPAEQEYLPSLLDQRIASGVSIGRAAQALPGADIESAAVPGAGHCSRLDVATGEHGSGVWAAIRDRIQSPSDLIYG
jgi:hypothetical protein